MTDWIASLFPGGRPTLTHVAAFYATYALGFGAFFLVIGLFRAMARRAMLRQQTEAALRWYDRLWFLFAPAVRKELKPQIQINLGLVHASQGHHERALRLLQEARRGSRSLKTPDLLIQSCVLIARLQQQAHRWDQAAFALQEARKASEQDRRTPGLLRIVRLQADLATQRGATDIALTHWHTLRRLADARADTPTAILALTQLGRTAYERGDWDAADEILSDAVSRVREDRLTDRNAILACLLFGRLQLQRGQYELARGYLLDAVLNARQREEPSLECSAQTEIARLWVEQARFDKAEEAGDAALALANRLHDTARQAMATQVLGDLYVQSEQWQGARVFLKRSFELLHQSPLPRTSLLVRTGQALVEAHTGSPADALALLHDLDREARQLHAGFERITILDALARVALLMEDGEWAQRYQRAAHALRQDLGVTAALSVQYRRPVRVTVAIGG